MGFTVSALPDYVDQTSEELISRPHFENTSGQYFSVQSGIKASAAIQLFNASAVPQSDAACGFTASGDVDFSQRLITVGPIKYQDNLCLNTLRAKWTQVLLRAGSQDESEEVTFAKALTDELIGQINEDNENQDWQGDTDSSDEYLNKYDGLIKNIDAGSPIAGNTGGVTSGTGFTTGASGNCDTIAYAMADARPAALKRKTTIKMFVGTDYFDKLVDTLIAKNNYHIDATQYAGYVMKLPGRNVEVVGVHGLDGTNRMFLSYQENFVLGVDLQNEEEVFDSWYSKDDDVVKYSIKFKRGVNVQYTTDVVQFTFA